jgi:hypothetical protein
MIAVSTLLVLLRTLRDNTRIDGLFLLAPLVGLARGCPSGHPTGTIAPAPNASTSPWRSSTATVRSSTCICVNLFDQIASEIMGAEATRAIGRALPAMVMVGTEATQRVEAFGHGDQFTPSTDTVTGVFTDSSCPTFTGVLEAVVGIAICPFWPPPTHFTVHTVDAVTVNVPMCWNRHPHVGESSAGLFAQYASSKAVPSPQVTDWPSPLDHDTAPAVAVAVTVTPPYVAVTDCGPQVLASGLPTQSHTGIPTQVRR